MDASKRREARAWAYEEFGHAELGDTRRTARLVRMAASLAERPGGKILDVFRSNAEQDRDRPLQYDATREVLRRPRRSYYEERYRERTLNNLRRRAGAMGFALVASAEGAP